MHPDELVQAVRYSNDDDGYPGRRVRKVLDGFGQLSKPIAGTQTEPAQADLRAPDIIHASASAPNRVSRQAPAGSAPD